MHLMPSRARQLQTSVQRHNCHSPANKLYQTRFEADLQFAEPKAHAEQSNVHNLNQPVVVHIAHAPEATTLLSHFSSALQNLASVSLRDSVCP